MTNGIDFVNLDLARQINDERLRAAEEYHRGTLARGDKDARTQRWWHRRDTPPTFRPRAA